MEYFELLHLKKEPFSSSPDPEFFYRSRSHEECLQKLEIAIRLRRGLNIVFGDVGTGKTTLSRILIQTFDEEKDRFLFYLILDPSFGSELEFLMALIRIFGLKPPEDPSPFNCKNIIQSYLFKRGVEEERIISLIIDEGQKLSRESIEILRELLNYETNECKLIQLVVFGQMELMEKLRGYRNLMDRVNMVYVLRPLSLEETRSMIKFRLSKAGMEPQRILFTEKAVRLIHKYSKGYPRKVITLCHHALLSTIIKQKDQVDEMAIQSIWPIKEEKGIFIEKEVSFLNRWRALFLISTLFIIIAGGGLFLYLNDFDLRRAHDDRVAIRIPIEPISIKPPQDYEKEEVEERPKGEIRIKETIKNESSLNGKIPKGGKVILVKKGDTLFRLARGVYGSHFNQEILRRVLEVNSFISNPNKILPGQKIVFPEKSLLLSTRREGFNE
jgi:general secretion pathway protein A